MRERQYRRVAVLSDVHGNAVALEAVLGELAEVGAELVVFGGDLTWGPLPERTLELVHEISLPKLFVAGNAERQLLDPGAELTERAKWMQEQHTSEEACEFLAGFQARLSVDIEGLGRTLFTHGSPRSDEEIVTYATPERRMRALMEGVEERVLVTAHTHIQFDRRVVGIRSINAGSVGLPYEGRPGAYWAVLGPDVEFRRTAYRLEEAAAAYRATSDPLAEQMVEMLEKPATREELVEHGEKLEFAG
jgi:predicted phosphodiesterase